MAVALPVICGLQHSLRCDGVYSVHRYLQQVQVNVSQKTIVIPKIFKWYRSLHVCRMLYGARGTLARYDPPMEFSCVSRRYGCTQLSMPIRTGGTALRTESTPWPYTTAEYRSVSRVRRYKDDFGESRSDVLYFIFDYVSPTVQRDLLLLMHNPATRIKYAKWDYTVDLVRRVCCA